MTVEVTEEEENH